MFKIKILSYIFVFLLVFGCLNIAAADTVDISGDWQGNWESIYGTSGGLSVHIIQNGTNLSGNLTIRNTSCGTFTNLTLNGTVSGNKINVTTSAVCPQDNHRYTLKFTNGDVAGNSIKGYYYNYEEQETDPFDSGTFELYAYTITASAAVGGSITPSGTVSVGSGSNKTFNIIPDSGYEVSDVKVDGSSLGAVTSYTFYNISSNHTITATFTRQGKAMPWIPLLLLDDNTAIQKTLTFVTISGPIQVNENSTAQYTLTAYYTDGSSAIVTNSASWSENSGYASISSSGYLSTSTVTSDQPFTITASYGGKSDTHSITIKNVSSPFTTTYTITGLPLTDYDGNYTLEWTATGLVSSNTVIQEDSDTSFSSPTNYISYAPAHTYLFTDKDSGTYCYRVGANIGGTHIWSEPRCVTVNIAPSVTTLHVVNNTHYIMIDIQLNGAQKVSYPNYIGVGQSADFEITPGTVNFYLGVGFYDPIYHTKNVWFTYQGTGTINSGQTGTVTFNNPTIGDLLSGFKPAGRDWTGEYYCYSCPTLFHMAKFHFGSNGGWTLYDDNVAIASGTATLTSWPNYATSITFNLNDGHSPVTLVYPFGQFFHDNGPPDWPTIEYTAQ